MKYQDLRDFIQQLEAKGELKRIQHEIDPYLEMTEIADRTLKAGGPALLFLCSPICLVLPTVSLWVWDKHRSLHCVMSVSYWLF